MPGGVDSAPEIARARAVPRAPADESEEHVVAGEGGGADVECLESVFLGGDKMGKMGRRTAIHDWEDVRAKLEAVEDMRFVENEHVVHLRSDEGSIL